MKRALVIGGTGVIGLHVVDALLAAGWAVRTTRRRSSPTLLLRRRSVEMVYADLDDYASLEAAMRDVDAVFLTAARYPRYSIMTAEDVERAALQVRNVCIASARMGAGRLVYASSIAVLRPGRSPATERDVGLPQWTEGAYPTMKKAIEVEIDRARDAGVDVVSLLLGGCIGPWDLRLGTNGFVAALLHGAVTHWVDGIIHLVAVEDAARAHVAALDGPGARYIVAGRTLTVGQLIDTMVRRFDAPPPGPPTGLVEMRALADASEAAAAPRRLRVPVPREFVDIAAIGRPVSTDLAERELGMKWTPLDDALDATVAWLVRHRYVPPAHVRRSHHHAV